MVDTLRTQAEALALLQVGVPGNISAQDLRDCIYSLFEKPTSTITTYSTPGTYTVPIPATAKVLRVPCLVGGGGGGGGGRRGAAGTVRTGGGSGAGAARSTGVFDAAALRAIGPELTVVIGAGGAAGASAAADNSNGGGGGGGGESAILIGAVKLTFAAQGYSGTGGTTGSPPGVRGPVGIGGEWPGGVGASSANDGGTGADVAGSPTGGASGGGAGSGLTTANVSRAGDPGGYALYRGIYRANGGTNPGGDGETKAGEPLLPAPGAGGGGGASAVGAPGGNGGDGQQPGGGGGGGGASENGYASGAGGKGGAGLAVLIWEY